MLSWLKNILGKNEQPSTAAKKNYILVVDDGESERVFYSTTLKKAGYEVGIASNALEALTMVKKRSPDVIISDVCMPDMTGKEMCLSLKANEQTQNIPVVFLTGSVKGGGVVDCFDAGGEFYLQKPIDARCLIRQIAMIINDLEQETCLSR